MESYDLNNSEINMSNIENAEIEIEVPMLYKVRGKMTRINGPKFGYYIKHAKTGMMYFGTTDNQYPKSYNPIKHFITKNKETIDDEAPVYKTFVAHYNENMKIKGAKPYDYVVIPIDYKKDPSMTPTRDYQDIEKMKIKIFMRIRQLKKLKKSLNDELVNPREDFCEDCNKHYIKALEERHKTVTCSILVAEEDDFGDMNFKEGDDLLEESEEEEEFDL